MTQQLTELTHQLESLTVDRHLIHQVVVAEIANSRSPHGHTLSRANVRGGGRKPWRQKGTGRARHGSTRSPIWVGGGSAFGPRPQRNFHKTVPQAMRRLAFQMTLADLIKTQRIHIIDDGILSPITKTKDLFKALSQLSESDQRTVLVLPTLSRQPTLAAQNLPCLLVAFAASVRTSDLLAAQRVIVTESAMTILAARAFPAQSVKINQSQLNLVAKQPVAETK